MKIAEGQGASPGRASGPLALSAEAATSFADKGTPPIFVRTEMDADDMAGLRVAAGIVATRGGITGDGAVAARVLGKPCLVGLSSVTVRNDLGCLIVGGAKEITVREGEIVSILIDGAHGELTKEDASA